MHLDYGILFDYGIVSHFACYFFQIILLTWMPNPDDEYLFYVIAGMWGFKEAILQTQINGEYQLVESACIDGNK